MDIDQCQSRWPLPGDEPGHPTGWWCETPLSQHDGDDHHDSAKTGQWLRWCDHPETCDRPDCDIRTPVAKPLPYAVLGDAADISAATEADDYVPERFQEHGEHQMEQAERDIRALIDPVVDNSREGWACIDCDPDGIQGVVAYLVRDGKGNADPVCSWHKDERIHDAITYGRNCSRCGIDHSPLWPGQWPDPR